MKLINRQVEARAGERGKNASTPDRMLKKKLKKIQKREKGKGKREKVGSIQKWEHTLVPNQMSCISTAAGAVGL